MSLLDSLFGVNAILSLGKWWIFIMVFGGLLTANYVQYQTHQGTKAKLEAAQQELAVCQKLQEDIHTTDQTNVEYQKEQGDAVDNFYKTMPKRRFDLTPDTDE